MDKMMNRYITALLVVLTATGLEAQAYQSALKAARGGDVALEELCRHSAFQGKEAEILSFIRAIKSVEQRDDQEPAHAPWVAQVDSEGPAGRVACGLSVADRDEATRLSPALTTAIQIRAPSLLFFFPSCSATGRCSSSQRVGEKLPGAPPGAVRQVHPNE